MPSLSARRWLTFSLIVISALLSACAGSVWTTVSTYRASDFLPPDAQLTILPLKNEKAEAQSESGDKEESSFDELEFKYFADILAKRFGQMGYRIAEGEASELEVYLIYDVERQKRNDNRPLTVYGRFGYFYRYGSVVFVDDVDRDQYEFVRKIKLKVVSVNAEDESEPLLSLTAVSKGQCEHLASVYDEMLDAIFSNLNRPNGSVIRLQSKSVGPCESGV